MHPSTLAWLWLLGAALLPATAQQSSPPQAAGPAPAIFMLSSSPDRQAFLDHAPAIEARGYRFDPLEPTQGTISSLKTGKPLTTDEAAALLRQVAAPGYAAAAKPAAMASSGAAALLRSIQGAAVDQARAYDNGQGATQGEPSFAPAGPGQGNSVVALQQQLSREMVGNIRRTELGRYITGGIKVVPQVVLIDEGKDTAEGGFYWAATPTQPERIELNVRPAVDAALRTAAPEDKPFLRKLADSKSLSADRIAPYLLAHPEAMKAAAQTLDPTMFHELVHDWQIQPGRTPPEPDASSYPVEPEVEANVLAAAYRLQQLGLDPRISKDPSDLGRVKSMLTLMRSYDEARDGVTGLYGQLIANGKTWSSLPTIEQATRSPKIRAQLTALDEAYRRREEEFLGKTSRGEKDPAQDYLGPTLPRLRQDGFAPLKKALEDSDLGLHEKLAFALDAPPGLMDEGKIKAQAEAYLGSRSGSLKERMQVWNDYNSLLAKEDTVQHTATLSHELYGRQVEDHKAMSDDFLAKAARAAKPQETVTALEWAFYYSHALPEIRPQVQAAIKKLASALPPKQQAELQRSMKQWDRAE